MENGRMTTELDVEEFSLLMVVNLAACLLRTKQMAMLSTRTSLATCSKVKMKKPKLPKLLREKV